MFILKWKERHNNSAVHRRNCGKYKLSIVVCVVAVSVIFEPRCVDLQMLLLLSYRTYS